MRSPGNTLLTGFLELSDKLSRNNKLIAFLRIHFHMLLAHLGVALFSGTIISWAKGLDKGLLFGALYFIFMFIVHLYLFCKHKPKYGKNLIE